MFYKLLLCFIYVGFLRIQSITLIFPEFVSRLYYFNVYYTASVVYRTEKSISLEFEKIWRIARSGVEESQWRCERTLSSKGDENDQHGQMSVERRNIVLL